MLTHRMEGDLDSFHHRIAEHLTRRQPRKRGGGSWAYPRLDEAMGEAGFKGISKSIARRQNTVAQYIATQPILELCEWSDLRPGVRVSRSWWEQAGIDLEGAKKRAA